MDNVVATIAAGAITLITVLISSIGVTRAIRLRKDIKDVSAALEWVEPGSLAERTLRRSLDLNSAQLLAITLVPYSKGLLAGAIFFIVVGVGEMLIGQLVLTIVGAVFVLVAYVGGLWHVSSVIRLRDRQVTALLAGRPSGLTRIRSGDLLRLEIQGKLVRTGTSKGRAKYNRELEAQRARQRAAEASNKPEAD